MIRGTSGAGETLAESRIDEEDIRLTTGFADIFTAILLVVGGMMLAALGLVGGVLIAVAAFALGKPLVRMRQRRPGAHGRHPPERIRRRRNLNNPPPKVPTHI